MPRPSKKKLLLLLVEDILALPLSVDPYADTEDIGITLKTLG